MKKVLVVVLLVILAYALGVAISLFYMRLSSKSENASEHASILPSPPYSPVYLDQYKVYDLVNDFRASKGLNKLVFNPSMCSYAQKRLAQIHLDWSHNGYQADVKNKLYCVPQGNIGLWCGENLGRGYSTEQELISAWIASPEHLVNVVNPHYTETCLVSDKDATFNYVVQEFSSNY
jgi:uncharacterized protein YkwD